MVKSCTFLTILPPPNLEFVTQSSWAIYIKYFRLVHLVLRPRDLVKKVTESRMGFSLIRIGLTSFRE